VVGGILTNKKKAKGIEISHWKTGEAVDFQAVDPEESDYVDQVFPESYEAEIVEESEITVRKCPTKTQNEKKFTKKN
jgi:hypothetical protein